MDLELKMMVVDISRIFQNRLYLSLFYGFFSCPANLRVNFLGFCTRKLQMIESNFSDS